MIHTGDCLTILPTLPENSIDSCVTDPPYGLKFMGKEWDHGVPGIPYWKEVYRVLKPGSYMCAFGSPRTHHRLMCAIEDAGFTIRDCLMWLYSTGFPKGLNISKGIDKKLGCEREVIGVNSNVSSEHNDFYSGGVFKSTDNITAPSSDLAKQWDGWNTQLKPAHEIIINAYKPLVKNYEYDTILLEVWLLIERLLCIILPVNIVGKIVESIGNATLKETCIDSAPINVEVPSIAMQILQEKFAKTDMCNLQEKESTAWNIALLWNSILEENFINGNIFTTEMVSGMTIALKILKSFLLRNIPNYTIKEKILPNGQQSIASLVGRNLLDIYQKLKGIPKLTVTESVTKEAEHLIACIAEQALQLNSIKNNENSVHQNAQTVLMPNYEPIILCQRPCEGTIVENVMKWGVGGLNIDGCRIGINGGTKKGKDLDDPEKYLQKQFTDFNRRTTKDSIPNGRWPANLLFDEEAAAMLDEQSGASRFFYVAKAGKEERDKGCENDVKQPKDFAQGISSSNPSYSNNHPCVKPVTLLRYLIRMITPPNGTVIDPFAGSGSTGVAALEEGMQPIMIELMPEYVAIMEKRMAAV